ncbi:MAG: hypothetical protein IJ572_04535 [Bacilli bacterium]|nr:hypothetical protein [Bacilli bacterium]
MKESKFWIWFIPLFIIMCIGIYILLLRGSDTKKVVEEPKNNDAIKIKEEYENYNSVEGMIKVSLSEHNAYVYQSEENIKHLIENSDGLIYFGEVSSFEARKTIAVLDEAVSSTSITNIFYLDVSKLSEDFKNYLLEKFSVKDIMPGTLVSIQKGNVLEINYPQVFGNTELTDKEHEQLLKSYQKILKSFVDACDESC